ncbi:FAD-dependent oxidoreductase [Microbacterium sp.]|uniref:flavin monoamine oxidase family protein n=1 Tax=Microbacterium sp. TaxID=51671 RepID=UPI002810B88D|nr:FAD-dependent oxidoreductase [Microbacterium sp.]
MPFTRRTFLLGAGTGMSLLVLAACTGPEPEPTLTPVPPTPRESVPEPSQLWRSNWTKDPLSRGAVSYLPVGSNPEDRAALRSRLDDRVFFAGEATSEAPGTVRGAAQSGARAAREVMDAMADQDRVAIIGAGAAGAEAARTLTARGIDVIVIEARDRVGGRIDSREDDGVFFELGAWKLAVDADDSVIADVDAVPLEGAVTVPVSEGLVTATLADVDAAHQGMSAQLSTWAVEQSTADIDIETGLSDSGLAATDTTVGDIPAQTVVLSFVEAARIATGANPTDISTWFPPTAIGEPSAIPTGQLSSVVSGSLGDVPLALSTAVTAVAYDDDGVSLRLSTGESRSVDRVIVTVPLGVLKAGAIEFDPPLPLPMRSAIDAVGFGQVEVVRVAFDDPFWDTDAAVWSLVGGDAEIATWINLVPLTGEAVLLGIAGGDGAAALTELGDDALSQMVRRLLAPFVAQT